MIKLPKIGHVTVLPSCPWVSSARGVNRTFRARRKKPWRAPLTQPSTLFIGPGALTTGPGALSTDSMALSSHHGGPLLWSRSRTLSCVLQQHPFLHNFQPFLNIFRDTFFLLCVLSAILSREHNTMCIYVTSRRVGLNAIHGYFYSARVNNLLSKLLFVSPSCILCVLILVMRFGNVQNFDQLTGNLYVTYVYWDFHFSWLLTAYLPTFWGAPFST